MDPRRNFAVGAAVGAIGTADGSIDLGASAGNMPTATPFNVTVWPAGAAATIDNAEIMRVTAIYGTTVDVVRGQEGTTTRAFATGANIAATLTAKTLDDIEIALTDLMSAINSGGGTSGGTAGMRWRGDYADSASYSFGDVARHSDGPMVAVTDISPTGPALSLGAYATVQLPAGQTATFGQPNADGFGGWTNTPEPGAAVLVMYGATATPIGPDGGSGFGSEVAADGVHYLTGYVYRLTASDIAAGITVPAQAVPMVAALFIFTNGDSYEGTPPLYAQGATAPDQTWHSQGAAYFTATGAVFGPNPSIDSAGDLAESNWTVDRVDPDGLEIVAGYALRSGTDPTRVAPAWSFTGQDDSTVVSMSVTFDGSPTGVGVFNPSQWQHLFSSDNSASY